VSASGNRDLMWELSDDGKQSNAPWLETLEKYVVTKDQVDNIDTQTFIWNQLLLHGAYHVWCSPPNGGKTTIALRAAADLALDGFDVFYFQLDSPASHLKDHQAIAEKYGFKLVSILVEGSSERDLVDLLKTISQSKNLSDYVFILDTAKKFTDLNFKPAAKEFYEICRTITRRGGTVLSLAHTDKYSDDQLFIPEGVGDLRNDCDNLAMMYSKKDKTTGEITVSFEHDPERHGKTRGAVDMTVLISGDRRVSVTDYEDIKSSELLEQQEIQDQPFINVLLECINASKLNQGQLLIMAKENDVSTRQARRVLRKYVDKYWSVTHGEKNAQYYERLDFDGVLSVQTVKT
jgi:hypothetical protein